MRPQLPPLDLHSHIDPAVPAIDLERLGAVVFAATRSLGEYQAVARRNDLVTVWGVGCHPKLRQAQYAFDIERFVTCLGSTSYVSEIGLDGRSPVPLAEQEEVFSSILEVLRVHPRIASIHSAGATGRVLDLLERWNIEGAVLHWWRGSEIETRRAVKIGCWFSLNAATLEHPRNLTVIPMDRIFTETDHPSGDRKSIGLRQPGAVGDVETELARIHDTDARAVRKQIWQNFVNLVDETGAGALLPGPVFNMVQYARCDV